MSNKITENENWDHQMKDRVIKRHIPLNIFFSAKKRFQYISYMLNLNLNVSYGMDIRKHSKTMSLKIECINYHLFPFKDKGDKSPLNLRDVLKIYLTQLSTRSCLHWIWTSNCLPLPLLPAGSFHFSREQGSCVRCSHSLPTLGNSSQELARCTSRPL